MHARNKLNCAYLNGSLIIAATIGIAVQSWVFFALALAALVIANLVSVAVKKQSTFSARRRPEPRCPARRFCNRIGSMEGSDRQALAISVACSA